MAENRIAVPPDDLRPGVRYRVRWLVDASQHNDVVNVEVDGMAAQFHDFATQDRQLYLLFRTGKPGGDCKAIPWKRVVHLEPA